LRPNFSDVVFRELSNIDSTSKPDHSKNEWLTPEGIEVKSLYTKDDLLDMEHLNYAAGIEPYLRGPYSTMYVTRFTSRTKGIICSF